MARVRRKEAPNLAQQIGNALEGASQGMLLGAKLENAKAQREALQQRAKAMKEQAARLRQQHKIKGIQGMTDTFATAAGIEDPKMRDAFLKDKAPLIGVYANAGGIEFTPDQMDQWKAYVPAIKKAKDTFSNLSSILDGDPTAMSPGEVTQKANSVLSVLPEALHTSYSPIAAELVQKAKKAAEHKTATGQGLTPKQAKNGEVLYADQSIDKGNLAIRRKELELKAKEAAIPPKPEIPKAIVENDVKKLDDLYKKAAAAGTNMAKVDVALGAMADIATGILSGQKTVADLRVAMGAQELEFLETAFNEVGLAKIMKFAAEAGARAIDSDGERAFVQSVNPGINKDPKTNLALLLISKGQDLGSKMLYQATQEFISNKGDSVKFVSPLDGTAKYFNPKTLDVELVVPGEETEGYVPVSTLYTKQEEEKESTIPESDTRKFYPDVVVHGGREFHMNQIIELKGKRYKVVEGGFEEL